MRFSYVSSVLQMLHELVVALRGHPGHVFCERDGKFAVNPSLALFHPCEVALLNQVQRDIKRVFD
jgi:hypothetical protein